MKVGTVVTPWRIFLTGICISGFVAGLIPGESWGWTPIINSTSNTAGDTAIGAALCAAGGWMTGNLGIALAIIAVTISGIIALMGRLLWSTALLSGVGIATIFGASAILGTASCPSASTGYSDKGGLGEVLGILQSVPYLNLADTGSLALISGRPLIELWHNNNPYGGGGYVPGEVGALSALKAPVNGWIQLEYIGLPVGFSVGPLHSWEGTGTNANGDSIVDGGFFNVSGNNQYPPNINVGGILYYNGRVYTGSMPPGVSVQYNLFSDPNAYFSGCTNGACSVTSQIHYIANTNTGSYAPSTYCSTSSCIAPPL